MSQQNYRAVLKSENRDISIYPSSNYARYQLVSPLTKVDHIILEQFNMSNTTYLINDYNKQLTFREGGAPITTVLPVGNYNQTTFPALIAGAMTGSSGVGNTYTASISSATGQMTINVSAGITPFRLLFKSYPNSPFYETGFYVTRAIGIDTPPSLTQISTYPVHLDTPTAVYIFIPELGNNMNLPYAPIGQPGSTVAATFFFPLSRSFTESNYQFFNASPNQLAFDTKQKITQLSVYLFDDLGRPLGTNGSEYTLELKFVYPVEYEITQGRR